MLIDFTQLITNMEGTALKVDQSSDLDKSGNVVIVDGNPRMTGGKDLTLGLACVNALQSNYQAETNLSESKKVERFVLACKIYDKSMPVDVTAEEIVEMKKVCHLMYGTLVYARVNNLLEGRK